MIATWAFRNCTGAARNEGCITRGGIGETIPSRHLSSTVHRGRYCAVPTVQHRHYLMHDLIHYLEALPFRSHHRLSLIIGCAFPIHPYGSPIHLMGSQFILMGSFRDHLALIAR